MPNVRVPSRSGLAWFVVGVVLLGAIEQAWMATYPGDPTQRSVPDAITGAATDIAIVVGLVLLFIPAALPGSRNGLRFLPPAICAYALAGMSTFDPFYWPQRVRYIDQLSASTVVVIVAGSLAAGLLVWWYRPLGAVATMILVAGLFIVGFTTGAH